MKSIELKAKIYDKLVQIEILGQQIQGIQKEIQSMNEELKKALEEEQSKSE